MSRQSARGEVDVGFTVIPSLFYAMDDLHDCVRSRHPWAYDEQFRYAMPLSVFRRLEAAADVRGRVLTPPHDGDSDRILGYYRGYAVEVAPGLDRRAGVTFRHITDEEHIEPQERGS